MKTSKEIEQFFQNQMEEAKNKFLDLVEINFKKDKEIHPVMICMEFDNLNSPPKIGIVSLGFAFSLDKESRNNAIASVIQKLKPMICLLVSEAWYLKFDKGEFTDSELPTPSTSENREECVLVDIISPYQTICITIPIAVNFFEINNGVPLKTLNRENMIVSKDFESVFNLIYTKVGITKIELEEKLKHL